jgi:hypothetical protein
MGAFISNLFAWNLEPKKDTVTDFEYKEISYSPKLFISVEEYDSDEPIL